jgi:hypothetical protein
MRQRLLTAVIAILCVLPGSGASAAETPTIRSDVADTPACTTPERLMAYVATRNRALDPKFATVAEYYRGHGINLGIRWDWAFFQMLVETNYLSFRTPEGKPGNVGPGQNNFAGIASTGPGVPGESYDSVETGVLAHLQHLMIYSGTAVTDPVAKRTAENQSWLVPWAQSLGHPVTFAEMTAQWSPSDPGYADDIATVERNFAAYCEQAAALVVARHASCNVFGGFMALNDLPPIVLNLLQAPEDGSGVLTFWVNGAQYDGLLPDPEVFVERAVKSATELFETQRNPAGERTWSSIQPRLGLEGMCAHLASRCQRATGTAGINRICPQFR